MRRLVLLSAALSCAFLVACGSEPPTEMSEETGAASPEPSLLLPQEQRHLSNLQQLTFGGENAEAYFSFDGQHLSFQSSKDRPCDQIHTMRIDGSEVRMVSTGEGRTTCAHYMPDGQSIVYASTHLAGP